VEKLKKGQEVFFVSFKGKINPQLEALAKVIISDESKHGYKIFIKKLFFDEHYSFSEGQPAWYVLFSRDKLYQEKEFMAIKSNKKRLLIRELFEEIISK
jgi:hypothetical protein